MPASAPRTALLAALMLLLLPAPSHQLCVSLLNTVTISLPLSDVCITVNTAGTYTSSLSTLSYSLYIDVTSAGATINFPSLTRISGSLNIQGNGRGVLNFGALNSVGNVYVLGGATVTFSALQSMSTGLNIQAPAGTVLFPVLQSISSAVLIQAASNTYNMLAVMVTMPALKQVTNSLVVMASGSGTNATVVLGPAEAPR